MIDLQGVTKTYPNGVCALDGVDLHIEKGEFVFVVGHSGAGKSTLIKTLLREEVPTAGEVTVNGRDLIRMKQREIPYFRRTIGVVFQDFRLIPTMTVFDNVAFALQVTGVPRRFIRRRVPYILNLLGLDEKYKHYPPELSGGEQQRVALARALVNNPDLLIADEPTTALDVTIQHQILKQMRSLQEEYGTSIIFITHDLGVVAELCDRVVVLYGGLVMEEAEINDLFENPLHPYTMGLLASIPGLTKDKSERLQSIPGSPPDMTKPPKGCPFASRCQFARNICAAECPPFVQVGSRQARCWLLQPDAPAEGNPLHEKLAEAERKAH
ncbi:MAG: ABC transporter ATP-binding protein [Subdoligranulum sp.]|nr:ABC transporter ATP-binding protein [Subdoligranulum sp.]